LQDRYLLNIGPKGDGTVPQQSARSLQAIGAWMKVNGESIYGTTASGFEKLDWGRCTRKQLADGKTRLYLHVFDWPANGKLVVPGLADKPDRAFLLAGSRPLDTTVADGQLTVTVPAAAPDPIATVLALDVR